LLTGCDFFNAPLPSPNSQAYLDFWSATSTVQIEMVIAKENLKAVETYGQEKNGIYNEYYFPINLTITVNELVYTFEEVGIRQKGNIFSRGPFLNESGAIEMPFHFRLSFHETFDESFYEPLGIKKTWQKEDPLYKARNNRRFLGMKSLEFKWNRSADPSMINQVFAAKTFADFGVIAPRSTLGALRIQTETLGTNMGVYIINEAVDEIFIARHFTGAAAKGDLYKALWPVNLRLLDMATFDGTSGTYTFKPSYVGIEDTEASYHPTYDLKTNKKTSTHQALMTLVKTLHDLRIEPVSVIEATLPTVVDIPSFLNYAAISYLIGNPDDMRNNTNNTYIYFDGVTKRAYFIPYDNDWSLGVTWHENLTTWTATKGPLSPLDSFENIIRNPLYWYTIFPNTPNGLSSTYRLVSTFQTQYTTRLQTVMQQDGFTLNAYQSLFEQYQLTYGSVASTWPSISAFTSINAFVYHHQQILATL
jgi:spore coat protein CotH